MCCEANLSCFGLNVYLIVSCDWNADPVHCDGQPILLRVSDP